jgi:hypothetical protein
MNPIKYIKDQIHIWNRNFVGITVGRVGTGKSYTSLHLAELLDENFSIDRIVFKVEDLLELVHKNDLPPGSVIVFDEAGIGVSNRKHYMNKFNKAMAYLLQTWRSRNLILLVTVPDLAFVDAGVRKMFDALIECKKVIKSKKVVRVKWKFIQVNPQMGKAYYHGLSANGTKIDLEIGKPSVKIIHAYEKKKAAFLTELYNDVKSSIEPEKKKEQDKKKEMRRCQECGSLGYWMPSEQKFRCRGCGVKWERPPSLPQSV